MNIKVLKIQIILILLGLLFFSFSAQAYIRSSANYQIDRDSVNSGGTESSASASYQISDTAGEIGTGKSDSANYSIHAGYRQVEQAYLAVTAPSSIALTPGIPTTGGSAAGNGTWVVKTDNSAGYYLSIKASTSPAMHSGSDNFADYTPAIAGTPDYDWSIGAANSEFGYSPYNSSSQVDKFKNNGANCNVGSSITDGRCWYGLSAAYEQIANKSSRTTTSGEETKVNFQAEVNTGGTQAAGSYIATIVVTVVSN